MNIPLRTDSKTWKSPCRRKSYSTMENQKQQFLPQCSDVQFRGNAMKMKQRGLHSTTMKRLKVPFHEL